MDVDEATSPSGRPSTSSSAQTGIQVTYTEDINDNNEFFGKVQHQLAACQTTDRDIIVLTDWMAARMIRLGWVQKLDPAKIPNVEPTCCRRCSTASFDPRTDLRAVAVRPRRHRLQRQRHQGVRTVDELLTRPDLKGKVTALSEMRDTMGLLLRSNGHDPANFTDAQFDDALTKLQQAVDSGQIRRFTGNDYAPDLAKGDIAACIAWSGDVIQLSAEDEKVGSSRRTPA